MCTTCGCSSGNSSTSTHQHSHDHSLHHRVIDMERDLLSRNDHYAQLNRQRFAKHHIKALNFVSSPGSGKTTLLVETIKQLGQSQTIGVIEGDQQTDHDAQRIKQTGSHAHQINTGKGCHLDAHGILHALDAFDLELLHFMFIENVGNLVCPAAFDLGEFSKVAILSVTEGEDKPLKYPGMFQASNVLLINKIDLLPYLDFDVDKCIEYAQRINPSITVFLVSAKTGEGLEDWLNWLNSPITRAS